ncbi:MAG: hypothetical protein HWD58_12025 [Bacteroidota bacterium]|nr:MAG: hypothetical protein HWD58_12025 [Bacteroidota bacterium]
MEQQLFQEIPILGIRLSLSSASVAQPLASPASTTTYTVTVTGSNGCTATDAVLVNVDTAPQVLMQVRIKP